MKTYTEDQVRKKLAQHIKKTGTAAAAADAAGCTRQEVSIAVNGGRIPGKLLKAMGLQKVEVYTNV